MAINASLVASEHLALTYLIVFPDFCVAFAADNRKHTNPLSVP